MRSFKKKGFYSWPSRLTEVRITLKKGHKQRGKGIEREEWGMNITIVSNNNGGWNPFNRRKIHWFEQVETTPHGWILQSDRHHFD